jgi:hypothetical protein
MGVTRIARDPSTGTTNLAVANLRTLGITIHYNTVISN